MLETCPNCKCDLSRQISAQEPDDDEILEAHNTYYGHDEFNREITCPQCRSKILVQFDVRVSVDVHIAELTLINAAGVSVEEVRELMSKGPGEYVFRQGVTCKHCERTQKVKGRTARSLMKEGYRVVPGVPVGLVTCPACTQLPFLPDASDIFLREMEQGW